MNCLILTTTDVKFLMSFIPLNRRMKAKHVRERSISNLPANQWLGTQQEQCSGQLQRGQKALHKLLQWLPLLLPIVIDSILRGIANYF